MGEAKSTTVDSDEQAFGGWGDCGGPDGGGMLAVIERVNSIFMVQLLS